MRNDRPRIGTRGLARAISPLLGYLLREDNGMGSGIATLDPGPAKAVLRDCVTALQRVAVYRLPPALDRRLLWLSEN
jgi:hypothetical protein